MSSGALDSPKERLEAIRSGNDPLSGQPPTAENLKIVISALHAAATSHEATSDATDQAVSSGLRAMHTTYFDMNAARVQWPCATVKEWLELAGKYIAKARPF